MQRGTLGLLAHWGSHVVAHFGCKAPVEANFLLSVYPCMHLEHMLSYNTDVLIF